MLIFFFWLLWTTKEILVFLSMGPDSYTMFRVSIFFGPFLLAASLIPWMQRGGKIVLPHGSVSLLLYLLWSGVSLIWTNSDTVLGTIGVYLGMLCEVGAIAVMLSARSFQTVFGGAMAGLLAGAVVNLAFVIAMLDPSGGARSAEGVLLHPEIFATRMVFGAIAAVYLSRTSDARGVMLGVAALLVGGVVVTGSKTAMVAVGGLIAAFGMRMPDMRLRTRLLCLLGAGLACLIAFPTIAAYLDEYRHSESLGTLTGRLPLWEGVWGAIRERPALGYGFGSSFRANSGEAPFQPIHAHNEVLQQWYTLGAVGLALAVAIYVQLYRHCSRLAQEYRFAALALLLFAVIRGIADPEAVGLVLPAPLIIMFAYAPGQQFAAYRAAARRELTRAIAAPMREAVRRRRVSTRRAERA